MQFKVSKKQTICMCMIVKNESHVIARCIKSFAPIADYFIICDTGSSDNTIEVIKKTVSDLGLKGEVLEHPWKNFAHNRSLSLKAGKNKADYLLVIDADEVLKYKVGNKFFEVDDIKEDPKITMPVLDKDCYNILSNLGSITYDRLQLMSTRLDWRYESVVHEYAIADNIKSIGKIEEFMNMPRVEGARSLDANKYYKDALVLHKGLLDEPNNSRYYFYLAQSYRDAGKFEEAHKYYTKRLDMPGYDEELNVCYHQLGHCSKMMGVGFDKYNFYYLEGYNKFPHRLECLFEYIRDLRQNGKHFIAYNFGYHAIHTPYPKDDHLFILKDIYTHMYKIEIALCCFELKKFEESLIYFKYILDFNSKDIDEQKYKEICDLIYKICMNLGKKIESIEQIEVKYNLTNLRKSTVTINTSKMNLVIVGNKKNTSDIYKELTNYKLNLERKDSLQETDIIDDNLYLICDSSKNKFSKWNTIDIKNVSEIKSVSLLFELDKNSLKKYLEVFGFNKEFIKPYFTICTKSYDILILGDPSIEFITKISSIITSINRIILITYGVLQNSDEINNILKSTRHLIIGNVGSSPLISSAYSLFTSVGLKDINIGWIDYTDVKLKPLLDSISNKI